MNLLYENLNDIKLVFRNFLKWFVLSSISGIVVGTVITLFLKSLQYATNVRENNEWMLYLLPFGGALVSYLYFKYGKDSSKGNNLIMKELMKAREMYHLEWHL